jgi:hypothetical protein
MNRFIYKTLGAREIRLARIEPGLFDDDLRCSMVTIPFEKNTTDVFPYEALSYVWGNSETRGTMLCREVLDEDLGWQKSGRLPITQNLEAALRRFKGSNSTLYLWIDSLCIDQENIEERGEQVQMMAEIYARARNVRIWLGEYEADTNQFHDTPMRSLLGISEGSDSLIASMTQNLRDSSDDMEDVVTLLRMPWFSRAWVFQEAIKASHCMVHFGAESVEWRVLAKLCKILRQGLESSSWPWKRYFDPQARAAVMWVTDIETYRQMIVRRKRANGDVPNPDSDDHSPIDHGSQDASSNEGGWDNSNYLDGSELDLKLLLSRTRQARATDPRDKVYSIVSLLPQDLIEVSYDRSVREVYVETARVLLNEKGVPDLEFLSYVQGRNPQYQIPSWAPDWSSHAFASNLTTGFGFDASPGSQAVASISETEKDQYVLSVEGYTLFEVQRSESLTPGEAYPKWIRKHRSKYPGTCLSTETVLKLLLRPRAGTLIPPPADTDIPLSRGFTALLETLLTWNIPFFSKRGSPNPGAETNFIYSNRPNNTIKEGFLLNDSRCLVFLDHSYLGLAPLDVWVGDQIVFLLGSKVPFAVRKLDNGRYRLLGGKILESDNSCFKVLTNFITRGFCVWFDAWRSICKFFIP